MQNPKQASWLTFREFSLQLTEKNDIDPDYRFLRGYADLVGWSEEQLAEWVLLKTVIYDSESELRYLYGHRPITDLRFGNERQKHKRNASEALHYAQTITKNAGGALAYFKSLEGSGAEGMRKISSWKFYGPWAAWKTLDLCSCVLGINIDFSDIDFRKAYEYPLRGLLVINGYNEKDLYLLREDQRFSGMLAKAAESLGDVMAMDVPHTNTRRPMNVQELETFLCKYHSYINGHYHPGHDIERLERNIKNSPLEGLAEQWESIMLK